MNSDAPDADPRQQEAAEAMVPLIGQEIARLERESAKLPGLKPLSHWVILSERFQSGQPDTAERHNEHQP